MSDGGETSIPNLLKSNVSLAQVLTVAIGFERSAREFYLQLHKRVGSEVKPFVAELVAEEQRHLELLEKLANDKALAEQLASMTIAPGPVDASFRDYVSIAELEDGADVDELLEYAASRERVAYEHYAYLAEVSDVAPVKALFAFLRDEEKQHQAFVERRWAGIFTAF